MDGMHWRIKGTFSRFGDQPMTVNSFYINKKMLTLSFFFAKLFIDIFFLCPGQMAWDNCRQGCKKFVLLQSCLKLFQNCVHSEICSDLWIFSWRWIVYTLRFAMVCKSFLGDETVPELCTLWDLQWFVNLFLEMKDSGAGSQSPQPTVLACQEEMETFQSPNLQFSKFV